MYARDVIYRRAIYAAAGSRGVGRGSFVVLLLRGGVHRFTSLVLDVHPPSIRTRAWQLPLHEPLSVVAVDGLDGCLHDN